MSHYQGILTGIKSKTFDGREIMLWILAQCSVPINRTQILISGQKLNIFGVILHKSEYLPVLEGINRIRRAVQWFLIF